MPVSIVLGTQWGDEGKGKAVDYLADEGLATALFLATGTAGASLDLLLHGDAVHHDDPCAPTVIVAHDADAHRFSNPQDDTDDQSAAAGPAFVPGPAPDGLGADSDRTRGTVEFSILPRCAAAQGTASA